MGSPGQKSKMIRHRHKADGRISNTFVFALLTGFPQSTLLYDLSFETLFSYEFMKIAIRQDLDYYVMNSMKPLSRFVLTHDTSYCGLQKTIFFKTAT